MIPGVGVRGQVQCETVKAEKQAVGLRVLRVLMVLRVLRVLRELRVFRVSNEACRQRQDDVTADVLYIMEDWEEAEVEGTTETAGRRRWFDV